MSLDRNDHSQGTIQCSGGDADAISAADMGGKMLQANGILCIAHIVGGINDLPAYHHDVVQIMTEQ